MPLNIHTLLDGFVAKSGEELKAIEAFVKRFEAHLKADLHEVFGFWDNPIPEPANVPQPASADPAAAPLPETPAPEPAAPATDAPAIPGEHTDGA